MRAEPLLSLCLPTNGVPEWVFPVLESIYAQDVDDSLFEVVLTDNGKNSEFKDRMKTYAAGHENLIYAETDALPFVNEIESYKRANGTFIKFVNHRTLLLEGSINRLLQFISENEKEKPVIYFGNGEITKSAGRICRFETFDQFIRHLGHYSSWSTGMAMWKEDLDRVIDRAASFNELFPHTGILFQERNRGNYVIDDTVIFRELPQGKKPKGSYDLFYAFGVEYPWLICNLLRDKDITAETYRAVVKDNRKFVAWLYSNYIILKKYCSYDLSGLRDMYGVFYRRPEIVRDALVSLAGRGIGKLTGKRKN